jgi:hypothetical protein
MSYHRFNNLREMFQGHPNRVLMKNVQSEDYRDRPCKCPGRGCRYGNVGRKALIVYTVTIRRTGKYYIDATSHTLKKRVAGYLQSARQFLRNGTRSSTLAIHLAQLWQQSSDSIPSAGMLHDDSTNDRSTPPLEEQGATLYRFFLIIN